MFYDTDHSTILSRHLQLITRRECNQSERVYSNKTLVIARLNELLVIEFIYLNMNYYYTNKEKPDACLPSVFEGFTRSNKLNKT